MNAGAAIDVLSQDMLVVTGPKFIIKPKERLNQ